MCNAGLSRGDGGINQSEFLRGCLAVVLTFFAGRETGN